MVALVASMGASAVLLFATPHSPLAQPWPVVGGTLIAAFIGITSASLIPNLWIAGAVAVTLSILARVQTRSAILINGLVGRDAALASETYLSVHLYRPARRRQFAPRLALPESASKRYGGRDRRVIPNQVSIEQRPAIVDTRRRFGDWEADLVIGAVHQ